MVMFSPFTWALVKIVIFFPLKFNQKGDLKLLN